MDPHGRRCVSVGGGGVDRPLNKSQLAELRRISSRVENTATSFANEYNWGDPKDDPAALLERYFDVPLYVANWGTRRLILRFLGDLVDVRELQTYG